METKSASIEFTLDGKSYVYKGKIPDEIIAGNEDRYLKAINEHIQTLFASGATAGENIKFLLERMGAKITAWNSIRPDGTIRGSDLTELIIH